MEKEIWKDISGYDGAYKVSNYGRIWSNKSKKILKPHNSIRGEARLILRGNGKSYGRLVHRLVAIAFIENPGNYPEVNHKDENPRNNKAENLEWCTQEYNNTYGTKLNRQAAHTDYSAIANKNSKRIGQYRLDGELIRIWKSANECKREIGFDNSHISKCCRGEIKSIYGYRWSYV